MSVIRTIAKNTSVLLLSQIISYILVLFYTIYTARYLGASGFGILSFALALGAILSIFTELGLNTLIVREVSRDKKLANKYIGNTFVLKILLSIITLSLMFIVVSLLKYSPETATIVYYITISFVVGAFTNIFYSIFQAYEEMEYQSIGMIINSIIMFAGVLLIIKYQLSITNFALIYLISSIICLVFGFIICIWKFILPKIEIDTGLWKFLIVEAIPLTLASIFLLIAFKVDTVLLLIINGDEAVGYYNAAYGLMTALMFLPSVYVLAIFPLLSQLHVSSKDLLKRSYEKSFKYLIILGLPIAVGTTLIAGPIILLIYKSAFTPSIIALQILIWSIPIIFVNYIIGTAINSINKQRQMVKSTFIVMAMNIILNLLLLPKYGYIAASIITVFTELASFIFWYHILNVNGYKIPLHKILVKPVLASILMGLSIILMNMVNINLIIVIILAVIIYFGVLYILKTFSEEDIGLFKQIIGRT
jgi:O-antigen/teichoic acid export membrane protein